MKQITLILECYFKYDPFIKEDLLEALSKLGYEISSCKVNELKE